MKLFISALTKYVAGVVLFGALIFAPAGTLDWSHGWLMMGLLFVPMMVMGAVMNNLGISTLFAPLYHLVK